MNNNSEHEELVAELINLSDEDLGELIPPDYKVTVYENSNPVTSKAEYIVKIYWYPVPLFTKGPTKLKDNYYSSLCNSAKECIAGILARIMLEDIAKISKPF